MTPIERRIPSLDSYSWYMHPTPPNHQIDSVAVRPHCQINVSSLHTRVFNKFSEIDNFASDFIKSREGRALSVGTHRTVAGAPCLREMGNTGELKHLSNLSISSTGEQGVAVYCSVLHCVQVCCSVGMMILCVQGQSMHETKRIQPV